MNQAARDANEQMHRRAMMDLLRSIDASLKVLVERTNPINITVTTPSGEVIPWNSPYYPWVNT